MNKPRNIFRLVGQICSLTKAMSIFFKFGVESGDPQKVTCDGMDMSLVELKLAIKDLKGIKNVTDFDLQVNRETSGLF